MIWISVPVWGDRYCEVFSNATLPALAATLRGVQGPTRLVVHTDEVGQARLSPLITATNLRVDAIDYLPVPPGDRSFGSLSDAHRDVLERAAVGDSVVPLTADLVLSNNALASCEEIVRRRGKRLVCIMGMRVADSPLPEPGLSGHALLEWGWEHRHRMTRECTWPDGTSYDLWRMYFEKGDEVCCRLSLPHPLIIVKPKQRIRFAPTVDVNVTSNFPVSEIHLVTEPSEAAMIELSPPDKEFLVTEPAWKRLRQDLPSLPSFRRIDHRLHRVFFSKKIIIKGTGGDCGDTEVVARML